MGKWNKKLGKTHLLVGSISTVLVFSYLALSLNSNYHAIFPTINIDQCNVATWHEDIDTNWSVANHELHENRIVFNYTLTPELPEPFAAVYMRHQKKTGFTDLNQFNTLSIHIKSEKGQRIPLMLRLYNDQAELNNKFPEILLSTTINYTTEKDYEITLTDFKLPAWWLRHHGIENKDIDLNKISQLQYIAVGSCRALHPGGSDSITIKKISLFNDHTYLYSISGLALILLYYILLMHFKLKSSNKKVTIQPIKVVSSSEGEQNQLELIKNYLATNFQESTLSSNDLTKATNIPAHQIRSIFKEQLKDSFKNYLKTIRMEEVKRILIDSNLSISEAAYKCGFGDIPHFNRQFKSHTGSTPKEYRSIHKK